MAIESKFKVGEGSGVELEEGSYKARLLSIVHLGVQKGEFNGEVSYKDQLLAQFELVDELMPDGRPVVRGKRETNSMGKRANFTKLVQALGGDEDGTDLSELLGEPLMLSIGKTATGNSKISSYSKMREKDKQGLAPLMGEPKLFLDVDQISDKELAAMPDWLRKIINERVKEEPEANDDVNY